MSARWHSGLLTHNSHWQTPPTFSIFDTHKPTVYILCSFVSTNQLRSNNRLSKRRYWTVKRRLTNSISFVDCQRVVCVNEIKMESSVLVTMSHWQSFRCRPSKCRDLETSWPTQCVACRTARNTGAARHVRHAMIYCHWQIESAINGWRHLVFEPRNSAKVNVTEM